jgi:hypothetical protein
MRRDYEENLKSQNPKSKKIPGKTAGTKKSRFDQNRLKETKEEPGN